MYSVAEFGRMLADDVRMDAYTRAIQATVRPGSVVLDIGAGTGILSLLACRFGARKVYAVEVGDAIGVAKEIARANGLSDKIEFLHAKSTELTLPEQADVIVSDLRGVLPLLDEHIPSIVDARRRHLAPGGALIPLRDELWVGIAEAPRLFERVMDPWRPERFGFDMSAAREIVTNTWERAFLRAEQLLGAPQIWSTLDYGTVESPDICGNVTLAATRDGVAHGLAVWFDAVLGDGVGFSNAPGQPELVYGTGFFPFPAPVDLSTGDRCSVALRADLVGSGYIWTWNTSVYEADSVQPKNAFRQSTFFGGPLSLEKAQKHARTYKPMLNPKGDVDSTILQAMTGACSLDEIVDHVIERFPGRFRSRAEALSRVGELSERYSSRP